MNKTYEVNYDNNEHGTIDYNGTILTITQQAYVTGVAGEEHYTAHATDSDGNDYVIIWTITDAEILAGNYEDESDACDWYECQILA